MKREFFIKWKGYSSFTNSWEPEDHLEGCQDLVDEFVKSRKATEKKVTGKRKVTEVSSDVEILSDCIESDSEEEERVPRKIMSLTSKERSFLGNFQRWSFPTNIFGRGDDEVPSDAG